MGMDDPDRDASYEDMTWSAWNRLVRETVGRKVFTVTLLTRLRSSKLNLTEPKYVRDGDIKENV